MDTIDFEAGALTFNQWLGAVEKHVVELTSLSRDDFRDWPYAEAYEDGVEPRQAAIDMLAEDASGVGFLRHAGVEHEVSF